MYPLTQPYLAKQVVNVGAAVLIVDLKLVKIHKSGLLREAHALTPVINLRRKLTDRANAQWKWCRNLI
jgi:hypothetical protein